MAGQFIWCLVFSSFLSFFVSADLLEQLNITTKKTTQYDELFTDGLYAYNLKNYCESMKKFEMALADYKHQNKVGIHCREKCEKKYQESLVKRNAGTVVGDIELEYFRLTIYSRRCSQKCREKYLGQRSHVTSKIREDFEGRRIYSFLQFSYYKCGKLIKGVQAAYTYLEMWPEDKDMLGNMKYYKGLAMISDNLIFSLEPVPHFDTYFKAVRHYEKEEWKDAITAFEKALKEYYEAYKHCKLSCEDQREKDQILGKGGLFAVYVDILRCRSGCQARLATMHGNVVDKYLPRHYNYLQMSYWKAGKTKEAAECATSYLLLDPDDDSMYDNLKIFKHYGKYVGTEIFARKDAIDYHHSTMLGSKLLHLAEMYTDDSNMDEDWFEDPEDLIKVGKDEIGEITEDLIEGADEFESDFTAIRLSGLGPLKNASQIMKVDELLKDKKYEGTVITMGEEKLNGSNRFLADNFLNDKQCESLSLLAKTATLGDGYVDRSMPDGQPFSFSKKETFEGVTPLDASKAALAGKTDVESVELFMNSSEKARAFIEDYFQMDTPLYFSYSHLVCRTALPGSEDGEKILSHPIHSDNCLLHNEGPGTCPKKSPAYTWRDYSAILYLNGDFEGGEFVFAHPNETIQASVKPKCGRLVAFSAGVENLHGVLGLRKGRRCAVALWFTMRRRRDEQARFEAMEILQETKQKLVGKDNLNFQFATVDSHVDL